MLRLSQFYELNRENNASVNMCDMSHQSLHPNYVYMSKKIERQINMWDIMTKDYELVYLPCIIDFHVLSW